MPHVIDLKQYRHAREAERRALVMIEHRIDPKCANRSFYRITSESSWAAQARVDALIAEVETFGRGYGRFIGPRRRGDIYEVLCEVVVRPDVYEPEKNQ